MNNSKIHFYKNKSIIPKFSWQEAISRALKMINDCSPGLFVPEVIYRYNYKSYIETKKDTYSINRFTLNLN